MRRIVLAVLLVCAWAYPAAAIDRDGDPPVPESPAAVLKRLRDGNVRQMAGTPLGGVLAMPSASRAHPLLACVMMPPDVHVPVGWLFDLQPSQLLRVADDAAGTAAIERAVSAAGVVGMVVAVGTSKSEASVMVEAILAAAPSLSAAIAAGDTILAAAVLEEDGRLDWKDTYPDLPDLPIASVAVREPAEPQQMPVEPSGAAAPPDTPAEPAANSGRMFGSGSYLLLALGLILAAGFWWRRRSASASDAAWEAEEEAVADSEAEPFGEAVGRLESKLRAWSTAGSV